MKRSLRLLIVEDCEDDADLLLRELRRSGYAPTFHRVEDADAMACALKEGAWDLVISDYSMPRFSGLDALKALQKSGLDIPFILISGTVGEETAVEALKAGAGDFLVKGHLARLAPAIERELREAESRRQKALAQRALQESEARFRSLSASSPIGVFQTESTGRFLYANDRCLAILGLTDEECMGLGWALAIHPDDREALRSEWSQAMQHGHEFLHECRLLSPEGEIRWVHVRAATLCAESGESSGYVGTMEDISASKAAQEQIRRQFDRLTTLRAVDLAILTSSDLRGTLKVITDQVPALLGVDAADCLLLDPQTQTLEYAAGHGFATSGADRRPVRVGEGYAGKSVAEAKAIYVPDLRADDGVGEHTDLHPCESFVAYYATPLIAGGAARGVLGLYQRSALSPDAEWLECLESLVTQAAIAITNSALLENLKRSNADLAFAYDATLEGWVKALDLRDSKTEGHTQRVTEMTLHLARAIGMDGPDLAHVRRGSLLHDIGKIAIPDSILLKPGKLTPDEWAIMRQHPVLAYEWLAPIAYLGPCIDIPYCHHEKWDGSGYPRGLAGNDIPLAARLFAVVDVWDALCSDRPYRKGWSPAQVTAHLRSLAGSHFDPAVVDAFLNLLAADAGSLASRRHLAA